MPQSKVGPESERKEEMGRRTGFFAIAVVGAALAVLAACGNQTTPSAGGTTPPATPTPNTKTFTEAEWTIETPAGWTREDATSTADAKKAIKYKDAAGNYFTVALDPLGSDFTYDALWSYEVSGTRFEVVSKKECKGTGDEACADQDDRYSGYIMWKTGTNPEKVGGHVWYFQFGNSTKTTVDANLFEQIAESLRVTS
jgi:hypothetical protein